MFTNPLSVAAAGYVSAGISVVPIATDGSKCPVVAWKQLQARKPTEMEPFGWFGYGNYGLAVVTGAVSGNLVCIDCDTKEVADQFAANLNEATAELLDRLVFVESPRGRHHYFRAGGCSPRNGKLATDQGGKTLIDLKGQG